MHMLGVAGMRLSGRWTRAVANTYIIIYVILACLCIAVYLCSRTSNIPVYRIHKCISRSTYTYIPRPAKSVSDNRRKPVIAICIPTRSVPSWSHVSNTTLQTLLIPSILRTVTPYELPRYDVRLYLGINDDDTFWIEHVTQLNKSDWLPIHPGFYNVRKGRVPFNEVTKAAYDDGADYIVRVNDDSEFMTSSWITAGVQTLAEYDPQNVGVVGPTCDEGKTDIMTHDMVHRTHWDIFQFYYPPIFDNWYIDDWISLVYWPTRSTILLNWRVDHHTKKHGTRYTPDRSIGDTLEAEIRTGREKIVSYLHDKYYRVL